MHCSAVAPPVLQGATMDDDDLLALTAYNVPEGDDHPAIVFQRLIEEDPHTHFKDEEIAVDFLYRIAPKIKAGRIVLGTMMLPTVQGQLKDLFEQMLAQWLGRMPHFICIIDQEWWMQATPLQREALIFHELLHVQQERDRYGDPKYDRDGNPVFALVGHDVEAFNLEVERYGAWKDDIAAFIAAAGRAPAA